MRHRSPARWLAPVALVTAAVAVYAVVNTTLKSDGKTKSTTSEQTSTGAASTSSKSKKKKRTYVVKSGDVLSAIAEKTGVSVAEIERLNPSVDAAALHPGQKLKLTE
jgi:LysM repeat protein